MLRKLFHIALLVLALIGAYRAVQSGWENTKLKRELQRLRTVVGRLPIDDPAKINVVAIATDDPLHFAWRCHLPANFSCRWQAVYGGGGSHSSSSGSNTDSVSFIARVRVRQNPDGTIGIWTKWNNSSGLTGSSDSIWSEAIAEPERLEVTQLGSDGVAVVGTKEVAQLLQIQLREASGTAKPLLRIRFGSQQAWQKLESSPEGLAEQ